MKVLVIGGSYFFGRVFVMESAQCDITVVNRGTYSMAEFGVQQITGDRHDAALWQGITQDYDVLVDFCAYEKGDVRFVLEHIGGRIGQYILISTVDVYERGLGGYMTEDTPLQQRRLLSEAGDYIAGKVALEQEIREICPQRGTAWTILRPAILYGPYNYAPRESVFIRMMVQNGVLPVITGAKGRFQFVYVKDAAQAVKACLLNKETYGQAYNLCADETLDYEQLGRELEKHARADVKILVMTPENAAEQGILLPFPVAEEESHLCSNEKSRNFLGISYTSFARGMEKTYRAFDTVFADFS